jgi:hypothetical protein
MVSLLSGLKGPDRPQEFLKSQKFGTIYSGQIMNVASK